MTNSAVLKRSVLSLGLVLAAPLSALADATVGTGTAGSCTEAALNAAVNTVVPNGGVIRFNCGGPATINITSQKLFYWPDNPNLAWGIDGGGVITLNAQGLTRHILHMSGVLSVANITFIGGRARGVADNSYGGAIRSDQFPGLPSISLNLTNVTFNGNVSEVTGFSPPFSAFDYGGGAVFTRSAYLNVASCVFTGNVATGDSGGAIHGRASSILIQNSVFSSNSSTGGGFGGAIHIDGLSPTGANGSIQILGSTFSGNTALNQGGAMYFYSHNGLNEGIILDTVNMIGNQVVDSGQSYLGVRGYGGGLAGDYGNVAIRNSTFSGNTVRGATGGGGLGGGLSLTLTSAISIQNSTFSGNRAIGTTSDTIGGGMLLSATQGSAQILHSTITLNQAGFAGGGIYAGAGASLANSIVANNSAGAGGGPQCAVQMSNGGGALQFPDSNPRCANAIVVANPLLGALASNGGFTQTHQPQPGSAAVNAVGCALPRDQRGVARPQGVSCDTGSVEVACLVSLSPLTLPTGRQGVAYSQTFVASGAASPTQFSQTGTLPSGMSFNISTGTLAGTPAQSGAFLITVNVLDGFACTASRTYNLAIASPVNLTPTALAVDAGGNGVLEANQSVVVDPGWMNQTGAPVNLTGSLSSFIGPAGATYTINDGSAAYGTVANGGTGRCSTGGNCYAVTVAAGARPATHWDASAMESLSTGGPKAWALHVGGSFADVSSSSPFYPFIEILLHRGITGGCTGTTYCPTNVSTRDGMAVFVLVAKEGAGYVPPACGTPMFADVPASNPFCRWIEELARRGVVSGCGGGNYCPSAAVTRDAMSVFVLRTLDPTLNPPACGVPMFNDVPAGNAFCRWIEELARRGVVSGCGGGNYCPGAGVTREQMGVFISQTFGLTLYGP